MLSVRSQVYYLCRVATNKDTLKILNTARFAAARRAMQKASASCLIQIRFVLSSFAYSFLTCTIHLRLTDKVLTLEPSIDQEFTLQPVSRWRLREKLRTWCKKISSTNWGRLWLRLSPLRLSGKPRKATKTTSKEHQEHAMSLLEMLSGRSAGRCRRIWRGNDFIII